MIKIIQDKRNSDCVFERFLTFGNLVSLCQHIDFCNRIVRSQFAFQAKWSTKTQKPKTFVINVFNYILGWWLLRFFLILVFRYIVLKTSWRGFYIDFIIVFMKNVDYLMLTHNNNKILRDRKKGVIRWFYLHFKRITSNVFV